METTPPGVWALVEVWQAWRQFGGLPSPGSVEEQPAKMAEAFRILDLELALIQGYHQAKAERRATHSRPSR